MASLWRQKGRSEAGRERGRAAGRGQKRRSGRTASAGFPPAAGLPDGTQEPAAPMSGRAAGSAVSSPERAGREGPAGKGGRPESLGRSGWERGERLSGIGPEECHCERKRSKSGIRPPGVGGGCGRGRKGRRARFTAAALMRWRAKGERSLRPEALWAGARESPTCARRQGRREGGSGGSPWAACGTGGRWLAGRSAPGRGGWLGGPRGGPTCGLSRQRLRRCGLAATRWAAEMSGSL
ncbi:MAG: hypothetical protein KatS3mg058_0219 [Roseiflexus sp.]|nr:MAG: hypothetical protein KatS3mg058_0219 [Roseiflexus sp.]